MHGTPTYTSWLGMKKRCNDPKTNDYASYGGRGVTVCERWQSSFEQFMADLGPRPSKAYSLDRIDANGNYEPGNCRWATASEQANNRRRQRQALLTRRCQLCDSEFQCYAYCVRRGEGRYCSQQCGATAQRKRVKMTCPTCGKTFERRPSQIAKARQNYCSGHCAATTPERLARMRSRGIANKTPRL